MKRYLQVILSVVLIFCFYMPAESKLMTAEPDPYAEGTDLTNAFPGLYMNYGFWSQNQWGMEGDIFLRLDGAVSKYSDFASTLTHVIGNGTYPGGMAAYTKFVVEFDKPTNYFAADLIAIDTLINPVQYAYGTIYKTDGIELFSVPGIPSDEFRRFEITSPTNSILAVDFEIDYKGLVFDNLEYDVPVPEPSTIILLVSGMLGLGSFRRKLNK